MKKVITLILIACLLVGCAATEVSPTEPTATESVEPTEEVVEMAKCYFNEWILPALPQWDQDTYPYALIYQNKDSWGFYLMCLDSPFYVTTANGVQVIAFDVSARVVAFEYWRSDPWEWKSTQYNTQPDSGAEAIYLNPDKAEYIWTNTDIYNDSGVIVYPATEPVPIWEFNEKSFLIGYTLGLAGKPLPISKREPIAYLYNGVRLPDINEVWTDKETYPFGIIHYHEERQAWYFRTYGAVPVYYESYSIYDDVAVFPNSDTPQRYYNIVDGAWSFYRDANVDICADFSATAWASCDVLNEDGTVYLAASEPVPVYE